MTRSTMVFAITLALLSGSIFAQTWNDLVNTQNFWKEFSAVCKIYRPSKAEQKLAEYIVTTAEKEKLVHSIDDSGNILIEIPASPGRENQVGIVLQSHLDMVCLAREGSNFIWGTDEIQPVLEKGWLHATNTTLGADNGIGVAAMIDILKNPPREHGPLELLFTVDEEGDFSGVCGLKPDQLKGRYLLNIDSEEAGEFNIGCAGGQADSIEFSMEMIPVERDFATVELSISGGKGGHSGVDVHRGRANTIAELFKILQRISQKTDIRLISCNGGTTDTAIPTKANAIFSVSKDRIRFIEEIVNRFRLIAEKKFQQTDKDLRINLTQKKSSAMAASPEQTRAIIHCMASVPSGILAMSKKWPGNVQTSMNPGILITSDDSIKLTTHLQGSTLPVIAMLSQRISRVSEKYKATHIAGEPYKPWEAGYNLQLLKAANQIFRDLYGVRPRLKVVHAGVECGELKNIYPHLQMLSFGPDIRNAHTPDEMVKVETVKDFLTFLRAMIEKLPDALTS